MYVVKNTFNAAIVFLVVLLARGVEGTAQSPSPAGRYASVNGLSMYYEVHGQGDPIVLLHGAFGSIPGDFGGILPTLADGHRVIAIEQQSHGRTPDNGRPLTYEQMADDVAELIRQLKIERADFFGFSMGGATALQVAVRHPQLVRKLTLASSYSSNDGYRPEILAFMKSMDPAQAEGWAKDLRIAYQRLAPRPGDWPLPVARIRELVVSYRGIPAESLRMIQAPTLIIVGDRDALTLEHTIELYRLLPNARLAVFPSTDHHPGMMRRTDWMRAIVLPFLEEPLTPPTPVKPAS